MKVLLFGTTGWIGGILHSLLEKEGHIVISAKSRLDKYADLVSEVETSVQSNITHVVLAAGLTGRPNVDWCEDHRQEVIQTNVIGTSVLADICFRLNLHLTVLATGCIYSYNETHPIGGPGFTELDEPNFNGSFYSYTKTIVEKILREFKNVLILRIRMPLSDDLHPRNFITKIMKYPKVVDIPNSMTILSNMIPVIPKMMIDFRTGVYNFTNPGVISHNQILSLYRDMIDPSFHWENFSLEEQSKILKAGRSNNCLDATKLVTLYPEIVPIEIGIVKLFENMSDCQSASQAVNKI